MANLIEAFSDAAVENDETDGVDPVTPAFNKAVTEKDAMTTDAAIETPEAKTDPAMLETARIVVPREELSDDAYAAVKRGDAVVLKELLTKDNAGDTRTEDNAFKDLTRATQEGETEEAHERILREVDPSGRADAGLAEKVLNEAGGNVAVAQALMQEIEDDGEDPDEEIAEENALQRGKASMFYTILQRRKSREFNAAAEDDYADERKPDYEKKEGAFTWFTESAHAISETVKNDAQAVAAAFKRASASSRQALEAAMAFCSTFFHFKVDLGTAPDPAAKQAAQEVDQVAAQTEQAIVKILAPEPKPPTNIGKT